MKEKILEVIKQTLELSKVDENIAQKNCEKWDSLNHINLIVAIETEFDIYLEPQEIAEMIDYKTIEKIIIQKK